MWLPITGFADPDVTFLRPNPDTTPLTVPAASPSSITTASYNAYNNSLMLNSSRGFTRTGQIKPDITAPGVNLLAPASEKPLCHYNRNLCCFCPHCRGLRPAYRMGYALDTAQDFQ